MRTALIVATLFVVAASISAQRRPTKIDATDAAEVTQRAVRGRGRARFVKTPEFAQAVTEQERTTPKVSKKQNAPIARRLYEVEEVVDDIPEATRRIAKPRVITETKFEATNAPKTKLFEPAPVAAETAPPEELIKAFADVPDKDLPEDVDITTMQLEMDEVEKISSTSSSTTTTTTPAPSTEAPSSRRGSNQRRGQRPAATTESASTAARSRTRVRTNRKQEDSSESTTSSSRTNFRAGRRHPEKETLRGRGPSILENDEDVSPKPRNERRTGSQRRKVDVSTTTEQVEPQKTRARSSASRGRKIETQAPASTRQPSRRRINTRPDTVKESVKAEPVEASTTPRTERAFRGRSRTRFNVVDETKLEVLPLFEAEPKVVPRTSSRRGRTRAPVDEFVASSTVENPIRHAPPPTSTSRSVTISSRQNKITTETKQVTEKPMTKETVQSEVSEGISTRKVVRRKKVEVKKKLLDRGTTKSEVQLTNVKSKEDSDEVNETDNYPPQFKALIQAKTKEDKVKKASRIAHTERIVASVPTVAPKPSSTSTTPSRKERVTQRSTTASTTISTTTTTSSPPTKKHTSTKSRKPLRYSTESVINPIKTVTANYPNVVPTTNGPPPTKKATTAKSRKPLRQSKEFENIPAGPFKTSTAIYPSIPPTPVITFRSSSQRSQPRSSLRTSQKPSSTTSNIPSTSSTTSSTTTTTTSTTTIRPSTAAVLPSSSPIPFNVEDDENELAATPKTPRRRFSTKRREYKPDAPLKLRIDQPEVTSKRPVTRKTSGRYHARFVAKSEEGVEKTSPKPSARPTFTRKSIKHEERKPIPRSNKIDGNTQLPQVTVKKTNRYSSRYRGENRSTPVRASTATPAYVPTVPTVTPSGQQVRGIQGELDGFPVISIDEPVNSLYSDNLISENATNLVPDDGKNDQSKPVSIIERIINSITSISTTTKPGEEKDGASTKGVTESSAILKIASKKPTLEQTTTKVAEVTTEKPTTIIERILSSLSAIQATDHVGTTESMLKALSPKHGGTLGQLLNLLKPKPKQTTTEAPQPYSTVAISLADYIASLGVPKSTTLLPTTFYDVSDLVNSLSISPGTIPPSFSLSADFNPSTVSSLDFNDFLEINNPTEINIVNNRINVPTTTETPITTTNPPATTVQANPTTTPEPIPEVTTKSEITTTPIPTEKVTTEIPMESSTEIITESNTHQSVEILARFAEIKIEPTTDAPIETTISPTMKAIVDLTTDAKVDSTTEMKLDALSDIKTESATEMKVDASTEMKVESTTEMKVESSTEMKVEASTEMKVESTTEIMVESSTEMKVEASTEMKVGSTTELKVDASTEMKVESTTEMKSETSADMMKVESTTEMNVEPTTAAKIEAAVEMKVETATEVKAEAPIESRIAGEMKVETTTIEAKVVEASTDSGAMVESSSEMGVVESTTEQKLEQTTEVNKLDLKMASESPVTEMNPSTTPKAPISGTEMMPEMTTIDLTANLIETEKPTTEAPLTTEQFKVSLSSVQITSGNEAVSNEEEATTVTILNRGSFPQRMGKLLPDADVIQEQVTNDLVSPQPQAQPRPIAVPSTTTPRSRDYFIFAVLPNNTIVRKRPPMRQRAPFLIVGVYPNNTIVHKFPNGTIVPEEPVVQANDVAANQLSLDIGNSLEVPSPMTTTTTTTTTTSTPTTTMAATATTTTSSPSTTTTTTTLSPTMMAMSEMLTTTLTPETSSQTLTPTTTPTEDLTSLTGLLGGKTVEEFKTIVNQSNAAYTLAVNNDTLIVRTKNGKLVRRRRPIRREFLDVDDSVVSSRINTEDADNEINAAEAATTKAAEATTKVAEATTAAQAPTTEAATTTTTIKPTTTTTTEAATTVKATEPAPITTTYRTTTINPYTTTDLATFISQFLSTLRPVYTPTTTYVPTTFAPTTPYVSTTYNDNIIEDTAPTVTITARSRTTTRLTTQPPTTTPIPTTTPMPTTTIKRVTTTQPPTTTTMPTTTTTEAPTTTPMIKTTTTLPPTTTNIPSKRRLETTTDAPIRRRSTLPPTTTTYLPTTTYIPTTTFVPTTKLGVKPEDVDIDEIIKKSNKKLSEQQLKELEALKALEREQAAILKQLSFLTNLNFGGQQLPKLTTKQPKLSTPSSLASRILSFAAERDKETTTTFRPPVETTTNPGVTIIEALSTSRQPKRIAAVDSKNEIESIIKQLNDNGVTSVTNPTIVSTYGKSQEAILAAILKERGIEPSTPKSLGDQIRQNHLFNEPTTTRRPRITTQRPPGRLAQGLNWILNALAPPPSTRRPKPKPRPKPVVVTTTEYEELIRESTDSTPVYAETTTRGKRPVNALSDAELANLIAQLEAIQKDPAKVRNLDLTPFKSLQNPTDQRTKNVEIISSSSSGSNKVTRAPKAYSGSQRIRASTINSIEEDPTTRPPRVVTTTQEVHTRPVTRGSRITLPPVSLDPVPGVNDNSPMVGGNFLNAAVNVTRAISTFLGSAIQGAAQSFQTMIGSGSKGVGGYFEGSRG